MTGKALVRQDRADIASEVRGAQDRFAKKNQAQKLHDDGFHHWMGEPIMAGHGVKGGCGHNNTGPEEASGRDPATTCSEFGDCFVEVSRQFGGNVRALEPQSDVGLDEVELVADIVAFPGETESVHPMIL